MSIRITCTCGAKYRGPESSRGKKIHCTKCGRHFAVTADAASEEPEGVAPKSQLHEMWLARQNVGPLGIRLPAPHLRRCMQCARYLFDVPVPCPECASATVGINLADVNAGRDRSFLIATGALSGGAARLRTLRVILAILALLAAGASFAFGAGAGVFGLVAAAGLAIGAYFLAVTLARKSLQLLHPVLRDAPPAPEAGAKLSGLLDRFIIPFLTRNNVYRDTADLIPAEQVDLLIVLLSRHDFMVKRENVYSFLSACALRADYLRFRAEFAQYELSNADTFDVYAQVFPEADSDRVNIPLLKQYLEEGQRRPDDAFLDSMISAKRRDMKVKSLEKDLEKLQPPPRVVEVSLDDVDKIDPANFRLLAGLIYQTEGYVVHASPDPGTGGADAVIEKQGRKTALQVRFTPGEVGESAVRSLASSKDDLRCQGAIVLTNGRFSPAAVELAARHAIDLVDRTKLGVMLGAFNSAPKEYVRLTLILKSRETGGLIEDVHFDDEPEDPIGPIRGSRPPATK